MGARGRDHAQRLTQRSALGELDVDAVDFAREPRDVGSDETALIDDHGKMLGGRRAPHGGEPVEVVGHERLLEELHTAIGEHRNHLLCATHAPTSVGVHADRLVGRLADRAQDFLVVIGAELHLENGIRFGFAHLGAHLLGRVEANGERRERRFFRIESPETPQRLAQHFPDEIVQRRGECGASGPVLRNDLRPASFGGFQVEGIARQVGRQPLERRQYRLQRLPIERRRIGLAPPLLPVRPRDAHPGPLVAVGRAARDGEGVSGGDGALLDGQLQSHRFFLSHQRMTPDTAPIVSRA